MGAHRSIDAADILETAYRLAKEQGLASVSVRSVAAACGVSIGSIYNYYPSKDSLIIDVVGVFWQEVIHGSPDLEPDCDNRGFVDFAERAASAMDEALSSFRSDWLPEIHALGMRARAEGKERESKSFEHMRQGLMRAYEKDAAIDRTRIEKEIDVEQLCSLVLKSIVGAFGASREDRTAFFSLLRAALYPSV